MGLWWSAECYCWMLKEEGAEERKPLAPICCNWLTLSLTTPTWVVTMTESTVVDEVVRVTVTPSQASYFAGEVFSVTVTITNIRKPEAPLPGRSTSQSATYGHRRGAHSVSYVPIARPPTSPGVRTAMPVVPAHPTSNTGSILRRGLVGKPRPLKGAEKSSQSGDPSRRRVLTKSLSVSIGPHDFKSTRHEDWKGKSPVRTLRTLETSVPCECQVLGVDGEHR